MSLQTSSAISAIEHAYLNRLDAARRYKSAGGRVAGFVSTAVPIEVIVAAGMYPVMITGHCRGDTSLADEWMEDMFDPMARAIFQSALAGELAFLDVLIIPRSADSFLRLYLYLREIERLGICKQLPRIVLYDLLQTSWESSAHHNISQLQKLRTLLHETTGFDATDVALRSAIATSNENRRLLRELLSRRRHVDVSGSLVLKAITTRYLLPFDQHNRLLQSLLSEISTISSNDKPRVVVAGNAQDNTELHRLLDDQGLHIVGDYHWLGDSCCEHDIESTDSDPWLTVSEYYHHHSLSSRRFPHTPEEIVAHAKRCNAQGVVFFLFEPEEALTWDSPNQIRALAHAKIESLVFENQPYVIDASVENVAKIAAFAQLLAGTIMSNPKNLLHGFRALDLTQGDAAACGRILASLGVEVWQIDAPGIINESALLDWRARNHGKRSITLDIELSTDRTAFIDYVKRCDFLIESFAPGYLTKLQLDYAALSRINPRLVMVSITPFGQHGPYAHFKGSELIASAMSGVLITLGDSDRAPVKEALDANYFHACSGAALGAVLAHYHRERTGLGQHVDQSVQEAGVSRNTNNLLLYQFDKRTVQRGGAYLRFGKASIRCVWKLRDGYAFHSIATGRFGAPANKALIAWMNELGYDNPMRDVDWDRYDRSALDPEVRKVWEAALAKFFADRGKAEIGSEGRRRGINAAVANEPGDLLNDAQLLAREYFAATTWPGDSREVRIPRYFLRTGAETKQIAPLPLHPGVDNEVAKSISTVSPASLHNIHNEYTLPLAGIKVLDFSWALVGALTTKQLGDFGADIVKVESAGRPCLTRIDAQVSVSKASNPNDKPWFAHLNTSKRGIALDLKNPASRAVLDRLIEWADVVVENFSPGTMEKLGLDYKKLRARKPDIIMVSGSVYGQTGPLAAEWGVDGTGAALSGRLFLTGWPDRDPVIPSVPYGDALLPLLMANATVAALDHRARTGKGCHIDASMFEVQVQQLLPALVRQQVTGNTALRSGNRVHDAAPHGVFPCLGEDRWIAIAVRSDEEWRALCQSMSHPELIHDDRFASLTARKQHEDALENIVAAWTITQDAFAAMHALQSAGIAAGVAQNAGDLIERDAQLKARDFLVDVAHPILGVFGHQSPPYKLSRTPAKVKRAPNLGEHSRDVCVDTLGFSAEEFDQMSAAGAFK
jgi:crotonobetainyl-CoA:carnitine CoA-transferase CaiB-like acyl-CoA transferase/benzoyl-CoA reductase/2-hydroxyglutaryl-CoA dehydratase subunit BcrC/BadD/HgdB